jgi:hypothetical protein
MLPKLAAISKERKIVFLLATNYVSGFDAAFSRGGRFDMLLQLMPPTLNSKLSNKDWSETLRRAIDALAPAMRADAEEKIADLTYTETEKLVRDLQDVTGADQILSTISAAWISCTLERPYDAGQSAGDAAAPAVGTLKWRDVCKQEAEQHGRIPPLKKRPRLHESTASLHA